MGGADSAQTRKAAVDMTHKVIAENKLCLFSSTMDPICTRTKQTLYKVIPYGSVKVYEVDRLEEGRLIKDELKNIVGDGTVPKLFVEGEYYGDADKIFWDGWNGTLKEYFIKKGYAKA
eukprot:TRINITY_DN1263_c0_g1_i2.p3 TRINITY_DN1263_c0_g1~~TRINITY_DN1263_c0_g1_i2.p3  ORF type:complete len:118 (-),score=11.79 TRINITY_DN1263_c0_g1_i2:153-506(-)